MKLLFYIFAVAVVVLFGWFWIFDDDFPIEIPVKDSAIIEKIDDNAPEIFSDLPETFSDEKSNEKPASAQTLIDVPLVDLENSVDIEVPFTSQAPYEI